jgi:hypothetical protein
LAQWQSTSLDEQGLECHSQGEKKKKEIKEWLQQPPRVPSMSTGILPSSLGTLVKEPPRGDALCRMQRAPYP